SGSNASPPELFTKPVTYLRGATPNIGLHGEAYTPDCLAGHIDREISFRLVTNDHLEPGSCVTDRVRIRKAIAKIDRYFPVVCMTQNGIAVAPLPTTHIACCQLKLHVFMRGNTAAPRGIMKPPPSPAASEIVLTGTMRMRLTSWSGNSESKQTR